MNELLCQIGWYYKKLAIIGNTNFFGLFEKMGGEAHLKKISLTKKNWGGCLYKTNLETNKMERKHNVITAII